MTAALNRQAAGAGKGVLGTNVPLLKEQQETELERGHELVKVEPPTHHLSNKRPKAGMPGSSVPPEDVHMVQEGDRQASIAHTPNLSQSPPVAQSAQVKPCRLEAVLFTHGPSYCARCMACTVS